MYSQKSLISLMPFPSSAVRDSCHRSFPSSPFAYSTGDARSKQDDFRVLSRTWNQTLFRILAKNERHILLFDVCFMYGKITRLEHKLRFSKECCRNNRSVLHCSDLHKCGTVTHRSFSLLERLAFRLLPLYYSRLLFDRRNLRHSRHVTLHWSPHCSLH